MAIISCEFMRCRSSVQRWATTILLLTPGIHTSTSLSLQAIVLEQLRKSSFSEPSARRQRSSSEGVPHGMCGTHPKSSTGSSVLKDLSHTNNVYISLLLLLLQNSNRVLLSNNTITTHSIKKTRCCCYRITLVFCHCALCVCYRYIYILYIYILTLFKKQNKKQCSILRLRVGKTATSSTKLHQDCRFWQQCHPTIPIVHTSKYDISDWLENDLMSIYNDTRMHANYTATQCGRLCVGIHFWVPIFFNVIAKIGWRYD